MASQETALWRAVIERSILDASGVNIGGTNKELIRREANDWLFKHSRDFLEVCALADLEPDQVRAQARKTIEEEEIKRQRKLERRKIQCPATRS